MRANCVELYWNSEADSYLIQRQGPSSIASCVAIGKFIIVSSKEIEERGLDIILSHLLEEARPNPDDKPELATFSSNERKIFESEHQHVMFFLDADKIVEFHPMHKERGGFVSRSEDILKLSLPCSNSQFLGALKTAYSLI